jgi:hypothetical protein
MSTTFIDSDRLEGMIASMTEYDEYGNPMTDFGVDHHYEGLSVEDMLEAQRRAISGNTGGGGTSGSSINTEDESPDSYSEWENIVEGGQAAPVVPMMSVGLANF